MPQDLTKVRRLAWVALLLVGALQGWVFRHTVSPDGVAYLDLSDAVLNGRPGELVNAYWSPVYPVLVGLIRLLVSPTSLGTPYWEFALLHVASLVGFVLSLAAFEWFLRALDEESSDWRDTDRPFASPGGRAVAYLLFGVASLGMISVAGTVPDFLVLASMLGAFAALLGLQRDPRSRAAANRLGVMLGLGTLAKAVVLPLSIVILATAALVIGRRGGKGSVLRAAGIFLALTGPWIAALSVREGHFTVGRTGSLNYAWYVDGQQPPNTGVMPALVVEKDLPLPGIAVLQDARGTNPLWYDPARWHRDVRPRFAWDRQWARLSHSLRYYAYVMAPLLVALLAIGGGTPRRELVLTLRRSFVVLAPCLAGLAAYAVTYTLSRLIAPFVLAACLVVAAAFPRDASLRRLSLSVVIGLALLAIHAASPPGLRSLVTISFGFVLFLVPLLALRGRPAALRWLVSIVSVPVLWLYPLETAVDATFVATVLAVLMWLALRRHEAAGGIAREVRRALATGAVIAFSIPTLSFGARAIYGIFDSPRSPNHPEWSTAQRMIRSGAPGGSRIALLGNPQSAGWARLARYRIVGVVPETQVEAFHRLSEGDRARVMLRFARAGATRLITP